jgi:hypothetical protein
MRRTGEGPIGTSCQIAGNADPIGHGRESHRKGYIVAPAEFFSLDNDVAMLAACDERQRKILVAIENDRL